MNISQATPTRIKIESPRKPIHELPNSTDDFKTKKIRRAQKQERDVKWHARALRRYVKFQLQNPQCRSMRTYTPASSLVLSSEGKTKGKKKKERRDRYMPYANVASQVRGLRKFECRSIHI